MAQCKIAVTPLPTHWSYYSLALSRRYIKNGLITRERFSGDYIVMRSVFAIQQFLSVCEYLSFLNMYHHSSPIKSDIPQNSPAQIGGQYGTCCVTDRMNLQLLAVRTSIVTQPTSCIFLFSQYFGIPETLFISAISRSYLTGVPTA